MFRWTSLARSKPYKEINPKELAARLDEFVLVDVRQPDELTSELGCISSARNIPLAQLLANGLPADIPTDASVALICRSGARSGRAAAALSSRGFSQLYNVAGGMIAWRAARPGR